MFVAVTDVGRGGTVGSSYYTLMSPHCHLMDGVPVERRASVIADRQKRDPGGQSVQSVHPSLSIPQSQL